MIEECEDILAGMRNGTWLDAQEFPPLEYAVPGIIPEGFGVLVAPPKAGKSWLVCGLGLACATGGLALGRIHVEQRPVLYLALEDGQRRLQSRSRRLMYDQPIPAGIHFVTKALPLQVIPMILEFLCRYGEAKPLIVIDTLGKARGQRPAGADLYQWDYQTGTQLKNAIDGVPGSTLLVVHHTRKAEAGDFVDSVSGSAGIAGSADYLLVLARKRHSDQALLSVTGRDVMEAEYALRVDDGIWEFGAENLSAASAVARERREQGQLGDPSLKIVAYVNDHPAAGTRAADLAEIGIDQDKARVYLNRLADSGRIKKVGRGLYMPVTSVTTVTSNGSHGSNETQITLVTGGVGEF